MSYVIQDIILPSDIIFLIFDCFLDKISCCIFFRINKFWYNYHCNPYYVCYPNKAAMPDMSNYIIVQNIKAGFTKRRKIETLHDYYCCRLYLNFFCKNNCFSEYTFFGFITNAPLELFIVTRTTNMYFKEWISPYSNIKIINY